MTIALLIALIPVAYLLGSVPFGLLVGLRNGVDIRQQGSKNIGATNAGRVLGKKFFFVVFFLDLAKSFLPMAIASILVYQIDPAQRAWQTYAMWLGVGIAAVLGHIFSVFLKFKGGKGVATSAGFMLGLFPYFTYPGLALIGLFIVVFALTRYISLASIIGAAMFPAAYVGFGMWLGWDVFGKQIPLLGASVLIALLIVLKHRTNIGRLIAGTEPKFTPK